MSFFADLKAALTANAAVSAIVGTRIWNGWDRAHTSPCVIMDLDNEDDQNYLETGTGEGVIGEITLTCRGDTDAAAYALKEAVRTAMAGYTGAFDLVVDSTTRSLTPKNEGSTAHWYDYLLSCTVIRTR